MKEFISCICVLLCALSYGNEKSITLMENIIIYLNENSLNTNEFGTNSKILNVNDLCFINNKLVFGTDYSLPKTKLISAYVNIDNIKVNLDVSFMYNPNIQMLNKASFRITKENNVIIITGLFSDGAGTYVTQWVIHGNTSYRTIISNKEGVIVESFYNVSS